MSTVVAYDFCLCLWGAPYVSFGASLVSDLDVEHSLLLYGA